VDGATERSPAGGSSSDRKTERRLEIDGGPITARVVTGEAENVAAGELLAIRLFPRGSSEPLALERQPAADPADLWIRDGPGRCVDLGIRDEAMLLGEALGAVGKDPLYEGAWEMAVRLWLGR
jgi:hypothetical protein